MKQIIGTSNRILEVDLENQSHEIYFNLLKPDLSYGKASWVMFLENLTCCINSIQICYFTAYAFLMESALSKYTPDFILSKLMQYFPVIAISLIDFSMYSELWSSVTGIKISNAEFIKAGERIHILECLMNTREGINRTDDTLPDRLLKQGRVSDPEDKIVPLDKMLSEYYKLRGYDNNGIPLKKTLEKLGIL